jgi:hypothetical protein
MRIIHFSTLLMLSVTLSACAKDEGCWQRNEAQSCGYYDHMIIRCTPGQLPDCYVEEHCTDYSTDSAYSTDSESETDSSTETETDSDTTPTGKVCQKFCVGTLRPCSDFKSRTTCMAADQCDWYDNANTHW